MTSPWEADPSASFKQRLGKAADEFDPPLTGKRLTCPDIWELDNGDIAVIGRDLTAAYDSRLPGGVAIAANESLVVIPRVTLIAAKRDIPDA